MISAKKKKKVKNCKREGESEGYGFVAVHSPEDQCKHFLPAKGKAARGGRQKGKRFFSHTQAPSRHSHPDPCPSFVPQFFLKAHNVFWGKRSQNKQQWSYEPAQIPDGAIRWLGSHRVTGEKTLLCNHRNANTEGPSQKTAPQPSQKKRTHFSNTNTPTSWSVGWLQKNKSMMRGRRTLQAENPRKHCLNQMIKINFTSDKSRWYCVWWEGHFTFVVSFSKTYNPSLVMRKTQTNPKRGTLYHTPSQYSSKWSK